MRQIISAVVGALALVTLWGTAPSMAQTHPIALSTSERTALVGSWTSDILSVGEVVINITSIEPTGKVNGSLYFAAQRFTLPFGDVVTKEPKRTGTAQVTGTGLRIEIPRPGTYVLALQQNGRLNGTYDPGGGNIHTVSFKRK